MVCLSQATSLTRCSALLGISTLKMTIALAIVVVVVPAILPPLLLLPLVLLTLYAPLLLYVCIHKYTYLPRHTQMDKRSSHHHYADLNCATWHSPNRDTKLRLLVAITHSLPRSACRSFFTKAQTKCTRRRSAKQHQHGGIFCQALQTEETPVMSNEQRRALHSDSGKADCLQALWHLRYVFFAACIAEGRGDWQWSATPVETKKAHRGSHRGSREQTCGHTRSSSLPPRLVINAQLALG